MLVFALSARLLHRMSRSMSVFALATGVLHKMSWAMSVFALAAGDLHRMNWAMSVFALSSAPFWEDAHRFGRSAKVDPADKPLLWPSRASRHTRGHPARPPTPWNQTRLLAEPHCGAKPSSVPGTTLARPPGNVAVQIACFGAGSVIFSGHWARLRVDAAHRATGYLMRVGGF